MIAQWFFNMYRVRQVRHYFLFYLQTNNFHKVSFIDHIVKEFEQKCKIICQFFDRIIMLKTKETLWKICPYVWSLLQGQSLSGLSFFKFANWTKLIVIMTEIWRKLYIRFYFHVKHGLQLHNWKGGIQMHIVSFSVRWQKIGIGLEPLRIVLRLIEH